MTTYNFSTLVAFNYSNGGYPAYGKLVSDSAGNLYGTTEGGGSSGDGTVFEIVKNANGTYGGLTTLATFTGTANGAYPVAGLYADSAGNLYGTTEGGGSSGGGTVFEIVKNANGTYGGLTTLVTFTGTANGANPFAGLYADSAGNLYGTTQGGGSSGDGTVFEIVKNANGTYGGLTTLVTFNGTANGANPFAGLYADSAGNLYGTTEEGGSSNYGTVFEIVKNANGTYGGLTTLVTFTGTANGGANPEAGLYADSAGNLYGTTVGGGSSSDGTVFEIVKNANGTYGGLTTLVTFTGTANGADPVAGLYADSAGNLYGTTEGGGSSGDGTVFEIVKNANGTYGGLTTLVTFTGTANGAYPVAGLYADSAGNLYGTTNGGGSSNYGTVFELTLVGTPTAVAQSDAVAFDTATAVTLTGSDPDSPALPLTYAVATGPADGTLSGTGANLTYTPDAGYQGADSFTFTDSNGSNTSTPATVSLSVAAGTPTAAAQSDAVAFDTATTVTLTGSDPDSPALPLTYAVATGPADGTLSGTGANLTYTPDAGYQGADSFTFTDSNGSTTSTPATVSLSVAAGTPTAAAQSDPVAFNTATAVTLTGSDPDSPALPLTYAIATGPADGTLSGTGANLTYTPDAGYQGADSFTFTDSNGSTTSTPATVSLSVAAGTPTAAAQSDPVAFNTATAVTLTGSDPDSPALPLTYAVATGPADGTLSGTGANLTYTPDAGYQGADSFTFTDSNGSTTSTPATVSLNVAAGTPTAAAQSDAVAFNTATAVTLTGSDPDSPALPLTYAVATGPADGTLSGTGANLTYTPDAGYQGADSFTFTDSNGSTTSTPATVSLSVAAGTPTAAAQSDPVAFNTATAVTLTGSDPDSPALPLTYAVATGPADGTLSGTGANLTYTPDAGYQGADSFTFTDSNGSTTSTPATVSLSVAAGTPTAAAQSDPVAFNTATAVTLTGSDPDSPALPLTYAIATGPADGTLSGTGANLTYTPDAGYQGADSFTFTDSNGSTTSTPATVSLNVAAGTPTAAAQSDAVAFDTATAVTLTGSDPDSPALPLTYAVATGPADGTLSGTGANLTYTPDAGYQGADSFTFTDSNGSNTSTPATVSLNVAAGTPTAAAQSDAVAFDTATTVTLTGSDPDSPALPLTYAVATGPADGTLSGTGANLTYTPDAGYQGADSFTFTDSNGSTTSTPATVSLSVAAGTPTAAAQSDPVAFDTATAVTLTGSDPDSPALPLTYAIATGPADGTLSGTGANLTYTPDAGYQGADSFTFTDSNGSTTSTPATVSLNVAAGTPTAAAQSDAVAFNTATAVTLTGSDPDSPALPLTYAVATGPADGTLSGTGANLTYTPDAGYQGADSFTFTDSNGSTTSTPATVSLTVSPPPLIINAPAAGSTVTIIDPTISGTTSVSGAGSTITLTSGQSVLGSTIVASDGSWSDHVTLPTDGTYTVTATDTVSGQANGSASDTFTINSTPNESLFGSVTHDVTSAGGQIYAVYKALLGVAPDAAELETGVSALDSGTSLTTLAQSIILSPAYQQTTDGQIVKQYVTDVYEAALGRAPDTAGLASWETALGTGALNDAGVATGILTSAEFQNDEVGQSAQNYINTVYEAALGRQADPSGLQNWETALGNGLSRTAFVQDIVGSAEYAANVAGPGDAVFVNQLYEGALGRTPDAGGLQSWTNALMNGTAPASVAVDIATSQEAQNDLASTFEAGVLVPSATDSSIARLYYGLLGQAPDAGDLQSMESAVAGGTSLTQVAQDIILSPAYQQTADGKIVKQYVTDLYETALGRVPDTAGLASWETALGTGALNDAGVATGILTSAEFQNDEVGQSAQNYINTVYEAALGRQADPSGLQNWETALGNGLSRTAFVQDIVGSAEYAANVAGPGDAVFVNQLYEGALGRTADAGGLQTWTGALMSGTAPASVAASITQSPEAVAHLAPKIEAGFHVA